MKLSVLLLFSAFITIFSCQRIGSTKQHSILPIDSIDFRKSYAAIMFDSTANLDMFELRKANLMGKIDSGLQKKLNSLGFMEKDSIVISAFKTIDSLYILKNKKGDSLYVFNRMDTSNYRSMIYFKNQLINDSLELNAPFGYEIAFADLEPGGYPEIFLLEYVYVMNGDNYYLRIYKVLE